jgi:monofunctional biosynthetic peptidoglycan transglycosylase
MPNRRARRKSRRGARSGIRRRLLRSVACALALFLLATVVPIALLRVLPPPTTTFMLLSHRADPATGRACERIDHRWVPWRELSPKLPWAVLVAEDQRFMQHRGFDVKAIADALEDQRSGRRLRGASTITQQVAKNLFLWPGRSAIRKGLEAWFTVWIELLWPKRRIIEMHLNIAQFGPCVFGAEAASQRYFGRPAARLSARQAALLAAVLPSPGKMRASDPGPYTVERAQRILSQMHLPDGPAYLRGL